jgi:hypothetical protein
MKKKKEKKKRINASFRSMIYFCIRVRKSSLSYILCSCEALPCLHFYQCEGGFTQDPLIVNSDIFYIEPAKS